MRIGYFLSSEEFGPRELMQQARMAEDAGFSRQSPHLTSLPEAARRLLRSTPPKAADDLKGRHPRRGTPGARDHERPAADRR
jgi:hypothetical protein